MGSVTPTHPGKYEVLDQWHSKPSHLRVICAGAGATGLCLAYKMKHHFKFENYDLVCYEKNSGVGGTWFENRYPGCACDVPAHAYTFTFEPNPNWSTFYAYGPEIRKYFEDFAKKYDLMPYIQLNSKIVSAKWNEEQGIYEVEVDVDGRRKHDWCHIFVNGTGFLNDWKWPKIEGLHDFAGKLMHSADWDSTTDWAGKNVAVIGTGSSSIQIVPQIQKTAKHLTAFMRSVTWICPPVAGDVLQQAKVHDKNQKQNPHAQYYYSEEEKKDFRDNPEKHLEYRQSLEGAVNGLFDLFIDGSRVSKAAQVHMRAEMERRIGPGHEELKEKLIPSWPPGCRRLTPGDGYLEALVKPNVTPVHKEIVKVVPDGVVDESGTVHKADILICATGFNLAFAPPFDVVGVNGVRMRDEFDPEPQVYLATTVPKFPNYFVVNGVRGNWASGTAIPSHEVCIEYILKTARKIQTEGIHSIEVKQEPVDQLYEHVEAWHQNSVWNSHCKSWYKNNIPGGKLWIWSGSALHFHKCMMEPRYEHYSIKYKNNNMWAFLGNGKVAAECLKGSPGYSAGKELLTKLAPYMRNSDVPYTID